VKLSGIFWGGDGFTGGLCCGVLKVLGCLGGFFVFWKFGF
jgi:hypothetical protein